MRKKDTTSRRIDYFRNVVVRAMKLLLEPSELECDTGFAVVREVLAAKVFPFLPSVVGSRLLNQLVHMALVNMLASRKNNSSGKGSNSAGGDATSNASSSNTDAGADTRLCGPVAPPVGRRDRLTPQLRVHLRLRVPCSRRRLRAPLASGTGFLLGAARAGGPGGVLVAAMEPLA